MKNSLKITIAVIATVLVLVGILAVVGSRQSNDRGGVLAGGITSDSFTYKNASSVASSTATVATRIRGGAGVLGNVTILTTSAHTLKLYDGSSSATTSATLIGAFPASAVVGTYTFDVAFTKGLIVETQSGYAGSAVIGYK